MGGLNGHGNEKGGEEENMDSEGELNLRARGHIETYYSRSFLNIHNQKKFN